MERAGQRFLAIFGWQPLGVALAVFLEVTILPYMKISGARPELALICVALFGMFLGSSAGLEAGIAAGFMRDIFTLDILWMNSFLFGLAGYLAGTLSSKFYRESRSTQLLFVFVLVVFSMCLHYALSLSFQKSSNLAFGAFFFASVVPSGLYTVALAVPILPKLTDAFNLRDYRDIF